MKILSIDQSYTSSGICSFTDSVLTDARLLKTTKELSTFNRASTIGKYIADLADTHKPDVIALEGLAFGIRGNATRDLAGLQYAIIIPLLDLGYELDKNVFIISPKSLKLFATGSGKASKSDMINAVPDDAMQLFIDSTGAKKTTGLGDLSDAYWIGKYIEEKGTK